MTLFLVLLMALTSVATEGGMGDTTSMAIVSARVISMEADSMVGDFMAVDSTEAAGTAVAATGRRDFPLSPIISQLRGLAAWRENLTIWISSWRGAAGQTHRPFERAVLRVASCNRTHSTPKVPDHSDRGNFYVRARLLR